MYRGVSPDCGGGNGGGGGADPSCGQQNPNPNWAGYVFLANCNKPVGIADIGATWTIPSLSIPPSGQTNCSNTTICGLAIWIGLEDTTGASDNALVQVGFLGDWNCTINAFQCEFYYRAVYQVGANNPAVTISQCNWPNTLGIGPGDTVNAVIGWNPSNDNYEIGFYDDSGEGHYCAFDTTVAYNMTPTYAPVIVEIPTVCINGSCGSDDLAQFSTFSIYNCTIQDVNGNSYACNSTGSSPGSGCGGSVLGWIEDQIYNSNTYNINVGPATPEWVSGCWQGTFAETWETSVGT